MNKHFNLRAILVSVLVLITPLFAFAQDINERLVKLEADAATAQSSADNAWILLCSALVLLMTVPGLALFYGADSCGRKTYFRRCSKV